MILMVIYRLTNIQLEIIMVIQIYLFQIQMPNKIIIFLFSKALQPAIVSLTSIYQRIYLIIYLQMIQNYLADSLVKNYTAPSYPIYISLQNSINLINIKKSIKDSKSDIIFLVERVGSEAQEFVLTKLLQSLEFPQCTEKPNNSLKYQLLVQLIKEYSTTTAFLQYFPEIISRLNKEHQVSTFFQKMLINLKLPLSNQIAICLSLYLSDNSEFSEIGQNMLIKKLCEAKQVDEGSEIPEKIIEELLFQISRNPELNENLQQVYNYLLETCQALDRSNEIRIHNYFKGDWQFFANETQTIEKPLLLTIKKCDYLKDLGPSATHQLENLKHFLNEVGPFSEEDVFECLMMMTEQKGKNQEGVDKFVLDILNASKKNSKNDELKKIFEQGVNSNKKNYSNWNIDHFMTYCANNIQNIKWQNVIGNFDRPKLVFASDEHFFNMIKAIQKIRKFNNKWRMPEALYFKKWVYPASQAEFLIHLFKCKEPEYLQIQQLPNKKIQKSVRDQNLLQKQLWGYIDLVQLLVEVSQYRFTEIRQIFEFPMNKYPELLLLTLSQIKPNKGQPLLDEVFSQVLPNYLHNHSTNTKLLENLWQLNQDLLISCISEIYKSESKKDNSFNLSRVLDITQIIKDSLLPFTTWNDYEFSIPLAVIAGKRQFLNFEPWLIDRIEKLGNSFVKAILVYIDTYLVSHLKKITVHSHKDSILEKAQLNVQLLNKIFFTIMMKVKREDMSPRNFQYLKRMFKECCYYFPQVADGNIPDEIEKETEREMNRIYKEEITIKQAIERMKKLKSSKKPDDQEQLASHLTFLCSQLTYHHNYPEKQLMITADLFVGIINANLIEKKVYEMFLRVLLEDVKEDNQKYTFAIKVIENIKEKLYEEGWFCENLIESELLLKRNPQIIQQLLKGINPPKILSGDKQKKLKEAIKLKKNPEPANIITVLPSNSPQNDQEITEINIEHSPINPSGSIKKIQLHDFDILTTLDKTKRINISDKQAKLSKITVVCNTLSLSNVEQKARELEKILDSPQAIKLLAYNIVFKRISISQNNGSQIFCRFIEKIPEAEKPVLSITYKVLQKWFSLTGKSVNDKKLNNFKNIGSWLGKLTIGKGYPIPLHKLNLRSILISSFSKSNRLNMNIPIVLKILEHINTFPEIFRSSSPWLSRLIGTINEIEQKLKEDQNTKSQIKAFFKSIAIKVDSIPVPQTSYLNNSNRIIISELDRYIVVNEDLMKYYAAMNIDLKMIITRAVDDSIQEIVEPVIDRAVKIAKVTTKQLILKDFAYQSNPDKFRESSYNVVKNMAGPLAHVTCREPLKASMNRSLKTLLSQHIGDQNEIDNIIQKAIPDNLDFGCTLIKQAVIESAEDSIKKDSNINQAIDIRIKALNSGQQFKDESHIIEIPTIVPEQLRPKPGGLSSEQYLVYRQFKHEKEKENIEKVEQVSNLQKILEIINQKAAVKNIREILLIDFSFREELLAKLHNCLLKENIQENELNYYIEVCQVLADYTDPKECWRAFKQRADLKKKELYALIKRLVRQKYFPESSLSEIDEANEQQNKFIILFEKWLDTAHQKIEPYLRTLEQIFNKSENHIKSFFSYSLLYAMKKVEESYSHNTKTYNTNYIEDYSKLIIISFKTIAENNCGQYLEHTIQAILEVFDKLQNQQAELSFQRPFFKLFTNLIGDVTRKQYDIDAHRSKIFYCVLAQQLQKIGPLQYPSFTFAWVELISNKNLIPALLDNNSYWLMYYRLLQSLFKFLREYITEQHLSNKQNGEVYQTFYKGVLKLMIVIIHDFPDFLSAFSLQLCLIPGPRLIQLTNMIISAYPKEMKFQFPLKISNKNELIEQASKGGQPKYFKLNLEKKKFLEIFESDPKDQSFRNRLAAEDDETLQQFILYVGWTKETKISVEESTKKITAFLIYTSDSLKQRLITYMVNLIRYPNSVTLFYINLIMDIVFNANTDNCTRDTILMNIMSRMNAQGPQAWGLDYLVKQLMMQKSSLAHLNISKEIQKLL